MIRYFALIAALLLAATASASAAERHRGRGHEWRTVSIHHYRGVCRCGVHLCGTRWVERGVLHRCRAVN